MIFTGLRIALVGPLPPPAGGMANQTAQLARKLREDGAQVQLLAVNGPALPPWLARIRYLRAALRLPLLLWRLWRTANTVDLFHIMANSGWSWHLQAAPALWIASLKGKPALLNYRGGEAAAFLARAPRLVAFSLRRASAIVVPSAYLAGVFEQYGHTAHIVPNVVDLQRFTLATPAAPPSADGPCILVARHLESLYDNASAVRAFAIVREAFPAARLVLAGDGPQRAALARLARSLGVNDAVRFTGPVDNAAMPALYQASDIVLNPSLADNMPNSVLEALACGVPVVSTNVGGIPALLQDGVTALLVPPGDPSAMAHAILALLRDPPRAQAQVRAGLAHAATFGWPDIAPRLAAHYRRIRAAPRPGAYTRLVARWLFPLHEWCKGHHSTRLLRRMERSQWWSAQQLQQWQLARLRALLRHAGDHVPYYRALFARSGFDPEQVRQLADLSHLPLLRKRDIAAARDSFKSTRAVGLRPFATGGSSGEPLQFFLGRRRVSHDIAAKWRATRWWGVDIGDREAVLWGSPIELHAQDRVRRLRDALLRTALLPAFAMSPARLDGYVQQLRRWRPRMLFGYPSALCRIASHASARDLPLDGLGVKVAFVTAERLYDEQRAQIATAFACPVANGYGGRDAGFIAHECPDGGMHITAEDIIVEIVDGQGRPLPAGVTGEIVVTHLATQDYPFIRYATGDVGALGTEPCTCGRGLPLLQKIEGRSTDFLTAVDGTVMHGLALVYIVRELPQVRSFKIIQESLLRTRVLLVCLPRLDDTTRATIVAGFQARLGAQVDIAIEEVDEIAAEASGKYRYVLSKVA
ncbi:Phenylacetate-coenzyme A ligase [Janthinobacterium sp. KBS0711]|uniref:glycosyltransferase n=1 Tax=Janthinobacterium sp. KBS0711 TaxID=1649647 RepID=UPI00063650B0|nr:glycosyltransferase [Janthinobacterium sp. KBS0711]KKO62160.1 Phenylacetate-coenzyme A ligase [Janthinobacterium sp. KBS0711]TSD72143.1 glycosyltransferase [Janthinobacterium sp. KBS0711]